MSVTRRCNLKQNQASKHDRVSTNSIKLDSSSIHRPPPADATTVETDLRRKNPEKLNAVIQERMQGKFILSSPVRREDFAPLYDSDCTVTRPESEAESSRTRTCDDQSLEISCLRLEIATLKDRNEELLRSESLQIDTLKELRQRSEAEALGSKVMLMELEKNRSIHDRLKEHLQCQICLELLQSPWTLSPCGHVGCFDCLMAWFLAPDPEEDEDDPSSVIYKEKTCPQCRALVIQPPAPSYILKNLVSEIQPASPSASVFIKSNPWERIFAPIYEQQDTTDADTDDDQGSAQDSDNGTVSSDYPSDSSEYRNDFEARREHLDQVMTWEVEMRNIATAWTAPVWEPPRFDSGSFVLLPADRNRLSFLSGSEIVSLLRRGATKDMIALYRLSYEHQTGITARQTGTLSIRLGWNISRSSNDLQGGTFMQAVYDEMKDHSERFRLQTGSRGEPIVVRLVPSRDYPDEEDSRAVDPGEAV